MTTTVFILSLVSFSAGFIDSIAGGGGLIMMPALLISGVAPQMVLGTNKFASTFGTGMSLINYIRNRRIVWKIVGIGIFFTLLGAFLGSKTILIFPNDTIGKIIVFLLPFAMIGTLIPRKEHDFEVELLINNLYIKVPLICLMLGFYDGFFGPGTGSFLILAFYLVIGLNLVQASATAKVFNLTSNISALIVFLIERKVIFFLGLPLAIANIAGNYLGSHLVIQKGANIVKTFLIISLVILLIYLGWKYF